MSAHARLSASAAHRWLNCAGSVNEGAMFPDAPSEYAAYGTFAHHIAAMALLMPPPKSLADTWLGNTTFIDGHKITCDEEMVTGVQFYLDTIEGFMQPGDIRWVEMPLLEELKKIDPDLGGTADCVIYRPSTKHLRVIDLKFGSGTYVEVDNNPQLKLYALGAMLNVKHPVHNVTVVVVQPRFEGANPVRPFHFKAADILDFIADVIDAADKSRLSAPPLTAGDWCLFCKAAPTCTELEKHQHALVAADFSAGAVYDPTKLAAALVSIPFAKARIKALEEFAYAEALKGIEIPGFKLVDKRPVRSWKSSGDVIQWAEKNAIDPYAPRDILSPAQLEKKVGEGAPKGKKKEAAAVLAEFIQSKSSGTVLVSNDDERQPAKRISVEDFNVIEGTAVQLFDKE